MRISKKRASYFIWISIITFFCLKLESVQYLTPFGTLYSEAPIVLAAIMFIYCLCKNKGVSGISLFLLAYYFYLIILTVINNGSVHTALTQICPSVSMILLCEANMRDRPLKFLEAIGTFLLLLIIIDFISILLYPNGLYRTNLYAENWILGYKTQRVNTAIPAIAALSTSSICKKKRITLRTWVMLFISILAAFLSQATGGLVAVILFSLFFFLVYGMGGKEFGQHIILKLLNAKVVLVLVIALNIVISVIQNIQMFEYIIVDLLDKSTTLTGRTIIWTQCLEIIREHPLFGVGYLNSTEFVNLTGISGGTQPHNMILGFLVYSGFIGLTLYAIPLYKSIASIDKANYKISAIFAFSIIINMIIGITSLNNFTAFNFASIIILWYINILQKSCYNLKENI